MNYSDSCDFSFNYAGRTVLQLAPKNMHRFTRTSGLSQRSRDLSSEVCPIESPFPFGKFGLPHCSAAPALAYSLMHSISYEYGLIANT